MPISEKAKEYMRHYRITHRDKILAQRKVYREANKEKIALARKKYNTENREKVAAAKKRLYHKKTTPTSVNPLKNNSKR
jgi:hypothetical protein